MGFNERDMVGHSGPKPEHAHLAKLREALKLVEALKTHLAYDPKTGAVIWIKSPRARVKIGQKAGSKTGSGYLRLRFQGKSYQVHRVAWALTYGKFPRHHIDHINGDKVDNRLENLREATRSQNLSNNSRAPGAGGYRGVCRIGRKWQARIKINGNYIYLGLHEAPEDAARAYDKAARQRHGAFSRFNFPRPGEKPVLRALIAEAEQAGQRAGKAS